MKIVLASGSPRRKELLEMLGTQIYEIRPAVGEEKVREGLSPADTVKELALQKAREVAAHYSDGEVIIAADTIVYAGGAILGKPHTEAEAADMLRTLSGKTHEVYSGICVICGDRTEAACECTGVKFRELSDDEIKTYIATGDPMDKAGAYGIQGKASLFIEGISGDYYNVMGLPLCRLNGILKAVGVDLL